MKIHCIKCGKQLEKITVKNGFDRTNGQQKMKTLFCCPSGRGSTEGKPDTGHDVFQEDSKDIKQIFFLAESKVKEDAYNEKVVKVKQLRKELSILEAEIK